MCRHDPETYREWAVSNDLPDIFESDDDGLDDGEPLPLRFLPKLEGTW